MLVLATAVAAITWRKKLVITEKGTAMSLHGRCGGAGVHRDLRSSSGKFVLVNYYLVLYFLP